MTSRPLEVKDIPMLKQALANDRFEHASSEYYTMDGAHSVVYENSGGPVGVLRYSKTLRLVAVFNDNDNPSNARTVLKMVRDAVGKAKAAGFTEIIFNTQSETLANFCIQKLGFNESKGEYVRTV